MQSPSSIEDFPHSPPTTSNNNFNQFEFIRQQQQQSDKMIATATANNALSSNSSNMTAQRPGVATSFLYKITELVAYTSAVVSDAYQTVTSTGDIPINNDNGNVHAQYLDDDVMQINADDSDDADVNDDELSDNEIAQSSNSNNIESNGLEIRNSLGKKSQCSWNANDDEEPPPPYDSSWSMPNQSTRGNSAISALSESTVHNVSDASTPTSSPRQIQFATPQDDLTPQSSPVDSSSTTPTSTKRKPIRVRRPRRLLRRKSSSTDIPNQTRYDDQDAMLLKVNEKLADMISQGKAALQSKVNVTEVEIMLAEEKEREERIKKELGLQTSKNRRRRLTGGSSSDNDCFSGSLSDSGSFSAPESTYCDYGYGSGSGYASSNGYNTPHRYASMHYNSPTQYASYASPVGYHLQSQDAYNMLGSKFSESVQGAPLPNRYHHHVQQSGGYDHMMPRGCSNTIPPFNGMPSGRFGGSGYGNSSASNYGPNAGSCGPNVGGFVPNPNSFGANSGHFGSNINGYGPNTGGYGLNTGGYGPNTNGYMAPNLGIYGQNANGYTGSNSGGSPNPNANSYGPNVGFGSNELYNNREFIY